MEKLKNFIAYIQKSKKLVLVLAVFLIAAVFIWNKFINNNNQQPQYQTSLAERGTLVVSVSESGQVAMANKINVTTSASGFVNQVLVKNGDTVSQGDKIASITLDQAGAQKQTQAYTSYLTAKSALESDNAKLYSLQSTMFSKWKTYTDIATNSTYQNSDGSANSTNRALTTFTVAQDDWLKAEADYKNQQGVIAQDQSALSSAWLSYQISSSTISAPMAGTIADLITVPGMQIGNQNNNSSITNNSANASSQLIASINQTGMPIITISLSEIDATKVKSGNKATVNFDALPEQNFTGRVLGINTSGIVSSGVTNYPATIVLDTTSDKILSNMSATVNIIIDVHDNVLLVPTASIQTQGKQSIIKILKNGQIQTVNVEIGESSDTQTEITSGINEKDEVIIGTISSSQTQNSNTGTNSPFRINPFGGGQRTGGGALRPGGTGR